MYQKIVEKEAYSKEKVSRLKRLFKELETFKDSPSVMAYVKKRRAELKA